MILDSLFVIPRHILYNFHIPPNLPPLSTEFLLTNGLGSYCSSSIRDGNTRRYHGLLVVADRELDRWLLLAKMDEIVRISGHNWELGVNQYAPDITHPNGSEYLKAFSIDPFPTWDYELPKNIQIQKRIQLLAGENTLAIEYTVSTDKDLVLELYPLVSCRKNCELGTLNPPAQKKRLTSVLVSSREFRLGIVSDQGEYLEKSEWYRNFYYPTDHTMNGDFGNEDLWNPGLFKVDVKQGTSTIIILASTDIQDELEFQSLIKRKKRALFRVKTKEKLNKHPLAQLHQKLLAATEAFVIHHQNETKVLAGYPWFKDWGRDSLISFKGLFLIPKRSAEGKELLLQLSTKIKDGLLPNRITGIDDYHSVDAPLWFINACYEYLKVKNDVAFQKQVFPAICGILEAYEKGTSYGIKMDPQDGCIAWSDPNENLSWMDGQVDNIPVIDRSGKAVEIQGLWFNALGIGEYMARELKDQELSRSYGKKSRHLKKHFLPHFWNSETDCLNDVVKPTTQDDSVRPNQLYCLSLPFPLLSGDKANKVIQTCTKKLLTAVGLKTLAQDSPIYQAHYRGSQPDRDRAYHNGTIWPFLNGTYFSALLQNQKYSKKAILSATKYYLEFEEVLDHMCAGQIAEIYEADTLEARGCMAQAWSVACNLEIVDALLQHSTT